MENFSYKKFNVLITTNKMFTQFIIMAFKIGKLACRLITSWHAE